MNLTAVEFVKSIGLGTQLPPPQAAEVVFCGRSNVGKSSLINKLCNQKKLARVSSTPGKTTTINIFSAGDTLLVDLPGYGYAKRSQQEIKRWAQLLESYFTTERPILLALLLLDCRRTPNEDDMNMLRYFRNYSVPFAAVLTKTDKLTKNQLATAKQEIEQVLKPYVPKEIILFSQSDNTLIQMARDSISQLAGGGK